MLRKPKKLKCIALLAILSIVFLSAPITMAFSENQAAISTLVTDGVTHSLNGEPEKAIPLFDKALALSPDNIHILDPRAAAYRKMGEDEKARADYEKIIDLADSKPEKHYRTGKMYWAYEKHNAALLEFNKAIALEKNADYFHSRGTVKMNLGAYQEAIQDYTSAITLNPQAKFSYLMRARAYRTLNREPEALHDEEIAEKLPWNRNP